MPSSRTISPRSAIGKLARFKIPQYMVTMDEFPMTASGKPQTVKLRALAIERLKLDSV
jgi:fatty-acyl-CoA synthase